MTDVFAIIYTETAREDLIAIGDHLREAAGVGVAERFIDRMIATIESLSVRPQRHRFRPELGPGVRAIRFRKYLIFYRVDAAQVTIVRVLHSARRITEQMLRV
jgi:toxin ParE1/3/4